MRVLIVAPRGPELSAAQLERLRAVAEVGEDPDVLLTGWGCPPLDAEALDAMPRVRAIVHAAGTVKGHVTDACWDRGIVVSSAADANAIPVAEFTLAAILLANKRAFEARDAFRAARARVAWAAAGNLDGTVGIIGASRVGRRLLELLRPFDLRVLVHDPVAADVDSVDLDELCAASDVLSLHAPATGATRHMIDARRLKLLPDGATLINTARGSLVDHDALRAELATGRISAVLDVTEPEPLPAGDPLWDMPNVFLTPHIAGAMGAETQRLCDLAVGEIERFARGEPFEHEVRREQLGTIA